MTKARTEAQKRRARAAQSALQAVCAISGVEIAAARDRRVRASEGDTDGAAKSVERARNRICAIMGWPMDDTHRALARDQRLATLHGRLCVAGRISVQAYRGIDAWEALEISYCREVLGSRRPVIRDPSGAPFDAEQVARLTARWMDAQGVIGSWRPVVRELMRFLLTDTEWRAPETMTEAQCETIDAAGRELAAMFGLDEDDKPRQSAS